MSTSSCNLHVLRSVTDVPARGTAWSVPEKSGEVGWPLVMVSSKAKFDELGNGDKEKSEKDMDVRAKAERDVVDEVSGATEVEGDTIDSVNVDKELGIVVET